MRYLLIAMAMVTISGGIFAQNQPRRDGDWEIKVEMQMPGMPMNMPAQTVRQCVTPADAADPSKAIPPAGRGGPNDCKVSDQKTEGNKVTWSMACPSQGMTGTGEIIYGENSYTGTMKMMAGGRDMTMKYTGKRLGDCTK